MIKAIAPLVVGAITSCIFAQQPAHKALPTATQTQPCLKIGETVSVTGRITPGINGGTYFELLKQMCVHYPKATDSFVPRNMETIGDKLPPSIYVEVTGELADPWPLVGIGIKVKTFRNVDAEVKAQLADWKHRCERWQDENSPSVSKQTNGGQIARITGDEFWDLPGHRCGLAAADANLPHEVTTIWRPEP